MGISPWSAVAKENRSLALPDRLAAGLMEEGGDQSGLGSLKGIAVADSQFECLAGREHE